MEKEPKFEDVGKDCPWRGLNDGLCCINLHRCVEDNCAVIYWIRHTERVEEEEE